METELRYIELKTGYSDNGPAFIGKVKFSKSGNTIYFNNKAFRKYNGISGNYIDVETGEEYWIWGVKKNCTDRHFAGRGNIMIDKNIVSEYLELIGQKQIDTKKFILVDIHEI